MASAEAEKTEMRQEGAIDTAQELHQDPQSQVNPDKVEQVLVEESHQAGASAYQFDPNASPEQKAEAAKGVGFPCVTLHWICASAHSPGLHDSGSHLIFTRRSHRAWQ